MGFVPGLVCGGKKVAHCCYTQRPGAEGGRGKRRRKAKRIKEKGEWGSGAERGGPERAPPPPYIASALPAQPATSGGCPPLFPLHPDFLRQWLEAAHLGL